MAEGNAGDQTRCEQCGEVMANRMVRVTMWTDKGLVVIEDVPASVCDTCEEQYYDESTSSQIMDLATTGFPKARIVREVTVPIFSLRDTPTPSE